MTVSRETIFDDGYEAFVNKLSRANLKGKLEVRFVNELGQYEAGIDAGGLFKEFLVELSKIVFNPNYGLFKPTTEHYLYPNPESFNFLGDEHLNIFYFVGLVVGRAIYDNILLEVEFSEFILKKILGKQNFLKDL